MIEFTDLGTKGGTIYGKDTLGRVWQQIDKEEWKLVFPVVKNLPQITRPLHLNEIMVLMRKRNRTLV